MRANRPLGVAESFGEDLPRNAIFRAALTGHLQSLLERGAAETVRGLVQERRAGH